MAKPPAPVRWAATWPKTIVRDGKEETFWVQIGSAFRYPPAPGTKDRIEVRIDSIPLNWDGRVVLFLKEEDDA